MDLTPGPAEEVAINPYTAEMREPWLRETVLVMLAGGRRPEPLSEWAESVAKTYSCAGSLEVTAVIWALLNEVAAARRAGREDAAKEKVALLDALRRLRDHWYGWPRWTEAAATVDVLIDAFTEDQHPRTPGEDVTP